MVIVQVISGRTGNPVSGKRVAVANHALMSSFITKALSTNSKGEAEFSKMTPCSKGEVYVDGRSVYKGRIDGFNRVIL